MIWFLSFLCITLYVIGVFGMGSLYIAIKKSANVEPDRENLVKFALTWPYQVVALLAIADDKPA